MDQRKQKPIGLYIHIPFCQQICHYCDFAKTARYTDQTTRSYFDQLLSHLRYWLEREDAAVSSVFLGGGTPGMFCEEYAPLVREWTRYLKEHAEISLEANPDDIEARKLGHWRELGFNRLSIGVQSFSERGLKFLTRSHSPAQTINAIEMAKASFDDVNIDLIYGWPEQTIDHWLEDLDLAVSLGVPHLSLYNLTYEPRTVVGRRAARGLIDRPVDEKLFEFYRAAVEYLAEQGYEQDEVSNWCKPDHSCRHNWLYWTDQPYLGIGTGAHGYLRSDDKIGERYSYSSSLFSFLKVEVKQSAAKGLVVVDERSIDDWLLEFVAAGMRTSRGVDLTEITLRTGRRVTNTPNILRGLEAHQCKIEDGRFILTPLEWFREQSWTLELYEALQNVQK